MSVPLRLEQRGEQLRRDIEHSLAPDSRGPSGWRGGRNFEGQTTVPSGLSNVVGIAAGYEYSLA